MLDVEFIAAIDELEDLLYQQEEPFSVPYERAVRLRHEFAVQAFEWQVNGNHDYRRFAEAAGVSVERVRQEGPDVIPLLPSSVFKRRDLVTGPLDGQLRRCTSSGTQGGRSVVNRDRRTLERFLGSVSSTLEILDLDADRPTRFYVLGPDTVEAADLWFSYVLSIVDLIHPAEFYVRDGRFLADELIERLLDREEGVQPVLIGPPVLVLELAARVKEQHGGIDLGPDRGLVITAGGWKRSTGKAVPREELIELLVGVFELDGRSRIRDCFNMVELNTVVSSCAEHRMHVPPWLRVTARDPGDLRVLGEGESGMLGYVDPLATSYPGFVLSDDLGTVSYGVDCACGRRSDILRIERRLSRVESRGCALKLDQVARP